ncbi:MAG TPA: hypothetical protein VGL46_09225 [Pseudonocardiaceae bacterium]
MSARSYSLEERIELRNTCTGEQPREIIHELKTVGGELIPPASTYSQQRLEAGLLLAAGDAVNWVYHERDTAEGHVPVVSKVHPFPDMIGLQIDDDALNGFLAEALPSYSDGELSGVPGLRPRAERGRLLLQVLGTAPGATARLYDVTPARWRTAATFVLDHQQPEVRLWDEFRHQLHPVEKTALRRKSFRPDALMSAILRRYWLWHEADWADTRVTGDDLQVRWRNGPGRAYIATMLKHDACAVPSFAVIPEKLAHAERVLIIPAHDKPEARQRDREAIRAAYTGEPTWAAQRGLAPSDLGLDSCAVAQRELRALLALHVFNAGLRGAPPAWRSVHTITAYDVTLSPRHDDLVIYTNAPDNLTGWFLGASDDSGLPGLRLECRPAGGVFRLAHLPTGARMTITSGEEPPPCDSTDHEHGWPTRNWCTGDTPPRRDELTSLASLPPRSQDMTTLLAAMFTRLATRDPRGRWDIGSWWSDPLGRVPVLDKAGETTRTLWGAHDHWTLGWWDHPREEDLMLSLTDPEVGLRTCRVITLDGRNELHFGSAVLRLEHNT